MQNVTLSIDGMTCGHCVQSVRGALAAVPGVQVRGVGIGAAQVTLETPAAIEAALAAVQDAGYEASVDATPATGSDGGDSVELTPLAPLTSRGSRGARTAP
jgi:copper chaperone CopZ